MKQYPSDEKIQQFIGRFLRYGALTACVVAAIGGIAYLWLHGGDPSPDLRTFHDAPPEYTTLQGIWEGLISFHLFEVIQLGVVLLIATPVLRVLFSIAAFSAECDKLYVFITSVVLGVILFSMFSGMKI